MRVPLATTLESRDGTVTKDAKVLNGIVEVKGDRTTVRKRPGIVTVGTIHSGTSQMLADFYGLRAIISDSMYSGSLSAIVASPSGTALTTAIAAAPMQHAATAEGAATPRLMFKNRTNAWYMNRAGTISAITYGATMGSYTVNLVSLVRVSSTLTATYSGTITLNVGDTVTIAGAGESDYNGAKTVTGVTSGSYTPARVIPITITRSGTTATATTVSGDHGLTTATAYTIAGANDSAYNGSKTITKTGATTFTYTVTETAATTRTWNSADKSANIGLSGSDLVASVSGTSGALVRATVGKSSGKWYWEVTAGVSDAYVGSIGVANSSESVDAAVGATSSSWGWVYGSTALRNSGTTNGTMSTTYTSGDVIGIALDQDAHQFHIYKNGVFKQSVSHNLSGAVYPVFGNYSGGVATVTANFGASAFAYSAPSGYSAFESTTPYTPAEGTITVTDPAVTVNPTFTYTQASAQGTPATGTITAAVTGGTVPGVPYINGYFCVMDLNCNIYSSAIDDPSSWAALDVVIAQNEPGQGIALAKSGNYLAALKEWSTEYFYDAKNATGSPFSPVENGFTLIGCASGPSVAKTENAIAFIAQSRQHSGRSVYAMAGLEQKKISTPDVDRIIDADDLATVQSFCIKLDGHRLYILTLRTSGVTLVYDFDTSIWHQWTALTIGNSVSVTSITRSGDVATVTAAAAHGLSDGDPVKISGANETEYNGIFQAFVSSTTVFTYKVSSTAAAAATGTLVLYPYSSGRFPYVAHVNFDGSDLLLDESSGSLFRIDTDYFQDSGVPVDLFIRTQRLDGGALTRKTMASIGVVGTNVSDVCGVRYSDDDSGTFSSYQRIDLVDDRPETRRCGAFRRRSLELRHVGNTDPAFEALELDIGG